MNAVFNLSNEQILGLEQTLGDLRELAIRKKDPEVIEAFNVLHGLLMEQGIVAPTSEKPEA